MTKIVKVTRKSKVGFGYTSSCVQGLFGLEVEPVTSPTHTGTIRKVMGAIDTDRTLESFISGGACYKTAWFVKSGNNWKKILNSYYTPEDLLERMPTQTLWGTWSNGYTHDWLDFEVE